MTTSVMRSCFASRITSSTSGETRQDDGWPSTSDQSDGIMMRGPGHAISNKAIWYCGTDRQASRLKGGKWLPTGREPTGPLR